jgi:uncharacterized protein YoaH (UPF0181 family)
MKGTLAGFLIVLAAIFFAQHVHAVEYGESAQQFMARGASTGKAGHVSRRTNEPRQADTYIIAGLTGSWLESNLGAGRPAGAPGAWCGFAMRLEVMSIGRADPGPAYNVVSSWRTYGSPAPRGAIGSLFISRGHISKVVAGECPAGHVRTISGNAAGGRVSYLCEPLSSLVVSRWP